MYDHATARPKVPGALILAALTAAALGITAVQSVPTANASCASFFGLGGGSKCSSTITSIAIAIGDNAEAHAQGMLGAAVTLGSSSSAATVAGAVLNLATTFGQNNSTSAGGIGSLAVAGTGINQTVVAGLGSLVSGNLGNVAVSFGSPEATETSADGVANLSVNLFGAGRVSGSGVGLTTFNVVGLNNDLTNRGVLNNVTNLSGQGITITNDVGKGGIANVAFNVIGEDNTVRTSGALAIAGALGSVGQTVEQNGIGVKLSVGRMAASAASKPAAATSAGGRAIAAKTSAPSHHRGKRTGH